MKPKMKWKDSAQGRDVSTQRKPAGAATSDGPVLIPTSALETSPSQGLLYPAIAMSP
jgi:hypothetical protein